MSLKLTDIATEAEIHAECVEDHSPFMYIRKDGGFSISMNGHYSDGELARAGRARAEANKFHVPLARWSLRQEYVRAWRAFKQNPTPPVMSVINQLAKALKEQK
jgi:hypothetical protein